jgi:hypothetical protein
MRLRRPWYARRPWAGWLAGAARAAGTVKAAEGSKGVKVGRLGVRRGFWCGPAQEVSEMRATAWLTAAVLLVGCVVLSTAQEEPAERGVTFRFDGPAGELLSSFRGAAGLGMEDVLFTPAGSAAAKEDAEKPVSVSLQGARLYDALEELSRVAGRRVRLRAKVGTLLERVWPETAVEPGAAAYRLGAEPRASTADFDVVIEDLGPAAAAGPAPAALDPDALAAPEVVVAWAPTIGTLRLYPMDLLAAERLVGVTGLALVSPDGGQEPIPGPSVGDGWGPVGRCLDVLPGLPPPKTAQPGEYKVRGAVLVSKVAPQVRRFDLPDAVGKPQVVGGVTFTITTWEPGTGRLVVVREAPAPEEPAPGAKPRGALWTEVRALDAEGEALEPAAWEGRGGPNITMETAYRAGEPRAVQVRALIITSDEEIAEEPFELTFRLPEGLVGR